VVDLYPGRATHSAKLAVCILLRFEGMYGNGVYPSVRAIQELSCFDRRTIFRALSEIERYNWMARQRRWSGSGRNCSNIYQMNVEVPQDAGWTPIFDKLLDRPFSEVILMGFIYRMVCMEEAVQEECDHEITFLHTMRKIKRLTGLSNKTIHETIRQLGADEFVKYTRYLNEGYEFHEVRIGCLWE